MSKRCPATRSGPRGAAQGIFAENPNRVYLLARGELPHFPDPPNAKLTSVGPSLQFPIGGVPWRSATQTALPGNGGTGGDPATGFEAWQGKGPNRRELGVDARWEHCLVVVDGQGNIIEEWTQWDKIFKRPHSVYISPYDPEKHVWVVDDHKHAIYKFTNDGKTLVQTVGTPDMKGADGTHFNRPTFMAWAADGSFYVADGYNGNRVAKFDKDGKFLLDWGMLGERARRRVPSYMNNVHGVAVDVETGRVFVNDRDNHRVADLRLGRQVPVRMVDRAAAVQHSPDPDWPGSQRRGLRPGTQKMLKYDLEGHLLYSWGTVADLQGSLWGIHGISTDQEGNLYTAGVNSGRFNKFTPRAGANPAYMVGKPIYSAWQQ